MLKYRSSFKIGPLIADGLIVINNSGEVKIFFVEGERTEKFDINMSYCIIDVNGKIYFRLCQTYYV